MLTPEINNDIEIISNVIAYIYHHKSALVDRLFHTDTEDYKAEWVKRPIFEFWMHLDNANRIKTRNFAKEYYAYFCEH